MSPAFSDPEPSAASRPQGRARLLASAALLLIEYLLISLLFDARALHDNVPSLPALGYVGDLAGIALLAAAAALILMGPRLQAALQTTPASALRESPPKLVMLTHALAYAACAFMTGHIFSRSEASTAAPSSATIAAWLLSCAAVLGSWLPLALPLRILSRLRPLLVTAALVGAAAGLLAWGAGRAAHLFWTALRPWTLAVAERLLLVVLNDVEVDRVTGVIQTETFAVAVTPVCSGIEGIGLIAAFLAAYLFIDRRRLRFPHALLLLPLGMVAVWLVNALRIALLVLVGAYLSPSLAVGGFHSKIGWVFFCAVALLIVSGARRFGWVARSTPESESESPPESSMTAAYLLPLLVLIGASLLTGLATLGFDLTYPLRMLIVLLVLWAYRGVYLALNFRIHGMSVGLGVLALALWLAFAEGGSAGDVVALQEGLGAMDPVYAAAWLLMRALGTSLIVPMVEELAFRGFLLRRLVTRDFTAVDARVFSFWPWLVSSAVFGALHSDWLAATLAGLIYALAQKHRGRVSDAIIAHATTNLLLALDALIFGRLQWLT